VRIARITASVTEHWYHPRDHWHHPRDRGMAVEAVGERAVGMHDHHKNHEYPFAAVPLSSRRRTSVTGVVQTKALFLWRHHRCKRKSPRCRSGEAKAEAEQKMPRERILIFSLIFKHSMTLIKIRRGNKCRVKKSLLYV